ncbi:MAG TPA: cupin domain-containing protein, partial [Niabella sp.]|nr:cupin domain-containing protein [Niabella sp.]
NVPMFNVTFEPGCRNNWHSHTGGQILVAVGGVGYYQERGKPAVRMEVGKVIEIAPNVEHWHGAAPDSWFSHIGVECNPQINKNTWLEPVSNEEYKQAVSEAVK